MSLSSIDYTHLPTHSKKPVSLRVTPDASRHLRAGHPWVFSDAITHQSHEGESGDLAVIYDNKRKFLAIGLYDPDSIIRIKVLAHKKPATINAEWFDGAISRALARRGPLLNSDTNGYRLIHGENDGLPGLIVDKYDQTLVLKIYSLAWLPHLKFVVDALESQTSASHILLRLSRNISKACRQFNLQDGSPLAGTAQNEKITFKENGLVFEVDPVRGQKTGFFLDQRDNRARVEELAQGKTVLNVFSYSGGFSLYAARGGATEVTNLDQSPYALADAERNFKLNSNITGVCKHKVIEGDAFKALDNLAAHREHFDIVVIDPPAFAQKQSDKPAALNAYGRLCSLGLKVLSPGGILVLASCSSRISRDEFVDAVTDAAKTAKRPLKIFEETTHALDHPIGFPQGEYLKCIFAKAA